MQMKWKVTLLTLAIAIPAFLLAAGSPQGYGLWAGLWPFASAEPIMEPVGAQIPFLMLMGALEAITFGLAVSFLVWGGAFVRRVGGENTTRNGLFVVAVAWILGNWWVHTNLHIVNGHSIWGLITIEYLFHVTIMVAAVYAAWALLGMIQGPAASGKSPKLTQS